VRGIEKKYVYEYIKTVGVVRRRVLLLPIEIRATQKGMRATEM
jgi:hypothetical protein